MKICIAQTKPIKGNVSANIEAHTKFIELALSLNTDAIFFPELSLTHAKATVSQPPKHLQIQGRFAKHIFILQMHRNIVSLFKHFGRQRFQCGLKQTAITLAVTL